MKQSELTAHGTSQFRKPIPPISGSNVPEQLSVPPMPEVKCPKNGMVGTYEGISCEVLSKPEDGVMILMRYKWGGVNLDALHVIFAAIKQEFDKHKVIALPMDVDLQFLSKEELVTLRNQIDQVMKEM